MKTTLHACIGKLADLHINANDFHNALVFPLPKKALLTIDPSLLQCCLPFYSHPLSPTRKSKVGNGTVIYDEWWWRERRKEGSWVGGEALTKRERKWNDLIYVCSTMPSLFLALYRCNAACALGGH